MTTHIQILQSTYNEALEAVGKEDFSLTFKLSEEEIDLLDKIIKNSERAKGVLAVIVTSLTHKIIHPSQDVRYHQDNLPNGYSGRGHDKRTVTPFMKSVKFPAMAESGWLTRSLEQTAPYLLNYGGSITPLELKMAFLKILDNIETQDKDPSKYLLYLFQQLIIKRDKQTIELAKPTSLTIEVIIDHLQKHFNFRYSSRGASRLPVLAIYSAYQCMMKEVKRFNGKTLMPLESHTSADSQSGSVGDLEIRDEKGRVFEGAEIKHGHKVTAQMVRDAFEKFKIHPIQRYYILSTVGYKEDEYEEIQQEIERIQSLHGCQVIVNGLNSSIKYYLRLLDDTFEYVNYYVENLKTDGALKFEHKEKWNDIVSGH
ncbi:MULTISPECIES: hypothetical protein [unclassified Sporosarcina]|uniref:hypothetical protein n=1 Tax=unclassified Sporosarcina TaxID=2647733 RepID=UPI00203A79E1|nr:MULTISPECIES: hypothetical protein [unclassified Sporosarcina]GKV65546.1 hypothetical protein NCCP2331_16990 [Sporosarcina sp. NCCP-2331]GLB55671.1 hypothetical protein NCCP2378_14580 [Sporosarcina sp. NCCP-2378]